MLLANDVQQRYPFIPLFYIRDGQFAESKTVLLRTYWLLLHFSSDFCDKEQIIGTAKDQVLFNIKMSAVL